MYNHKPLITMNKFLFVLLLSVSTLSFSQIGVGKSLYDNKWRFGGGMGLGFGSNDYFGLNISPFVGYEIAPSLEGGLTAGYQYSKWKYSKQNLFSVGPYLNYYPIQSLFVRGHYEYFTGKHKYDQLGGAPAEIDIDEDALWVGAGYRSPGKISFYTGIMYNVLHKDDSKIFSTGLRPIVGVSVGF